jgi:hypothetical protein
MGRKTCDLCEFSSYYGSKLERHLKDVHLGTKDFKCDKAFSQKSSLTSHEYGIHKKFKNYSCVLCNYTTFTNQELKNHFIVQHVDKNVESNNL